MPGGRAAKNARRRHARSGRAFCSGWHARAAHRSADLARAIVDREHSNVPPVDPTNDTIKRYVVHLYTYVPERRERTQVKIACFDTEAEAMRCLGDAYLELAERQAMGEADPGDRLSMVIKEPGIDEHNRQRRIEERRRRGHS